MAKDQEQSQDGEAKKKLTPDEVSTRAALIAQMGLALQEPAVHALAQEAKPEYSKAGIRKLVRAIIADRKEKQRAKKRAQVESKNTGPILVDGDPYWSARTYLATCMTQNGTPTIVFWRGNFYQYEEGRYVPRTSDRKNWDVVRTEIVSWLTTCRKEVTDANGTYVDDFKPVPAEVEAIYDGLAQETRYDGEDDCWLDGRDFPPVVAVNNGLLDPRAGVLYEHDPTYFSTRKIHATHDPFLVDDDDDFTTALAKSPVGGFLETVFGHDPKQVELLQEMFGYLLFGDNRMQKGFMIIGAKRSGKGTVNRLLTHFMGSTACAPKTHSLASSFGMQNLIDKRLATITDARVDEKTNFGVLAELLLSVIGDDPVSVDRKYLNAVVLRLMVRFLILSNDLPKLRDPTGVLASRFMYLEAPVSWAGREDAGLYDRLVACDSLWIAWAVRGFQQLHTRGDRAQFTQTVTHQRLIDRVQGEMAPVDTFASRFLVDDSAGVIETEHVYLTFLDWAGAIGIATWKKETLSAKLRGIFTGVKILQRYVPKIDTDTPEFPTFDEGNTHRVRCFVGVKWADGRKPTAQQITEWKENNSQEGEYVGNSDYRQEGK